MSRTEQRKGARGEGEVLALYKAHGARMRSLAATGDHLAYLGPFVHHIETKRQEVARPWQWYEQAEAETPPGALTVVAFRRSRSPWMMLAQLDPVLAQLERAAGV